MTDLVGLVLCGGESKRMGIDKSLIRYHTVPQRYYVYEMLKAFCSKVFLSVNYEQSKNIGTAYDFICDADEYAQHGPIGALLTAFEKLPDAGFLLVGCDYPMLGDKHIDLLLRSRETGKDAVTFFKNAEEIYEPLLGIYENPIREKLFKHYQSGQYSLQHLLRSVPVVKVAIPEIIKSIDTLAEMRRFI